MSVPRPLFRFLLCLLPGLAAVAANLPPETTEALPALTLARGATGTPIPLASHFRDPDVPGSAVRITVRLGAETRVIDLALFDAQAPLTVANFLAYVADGRYAANFFHRSVPGFIIQNGGFRFLNDTTFDYVQTYAPVANEPGISNTRGTVAMAKLGGDPDSATNQWFINLADNSANLDAQNGGFTVFGRVLGDGMAVADAIAAFPRYNASSYASAWTDLPLTTNVLARTNFIETNAAKIAPLVFTAVSDDPALVSATVVDGVLTLSAAPDRSGETTLRIAATDLEGAILETSFLVTVPRLAQTIEFAAIPDREYGSAPLTLVSTASSGLPVAIEVLSGPASLVDGRLTANDVGTVQIRVSQAGDADYLAAEPVVRSFAVTPAVQATIQLGQLAQTYDASPCVPSVTTSPAGLNYVLTYDGTTEVPISAGTYAVVATIADPRALGSPSSAGILTVARQPLTVSARGSMLQGGTPEPEWFTIPEQNIVYFVQNPSLNTPATSASAPGNYPITFAPQDDPNYELTFLPGVFTVLPLKAAYEATLGLEGFVHLDIAGNGKSFTGRLELAREAKSIPLRGSLTRWPDGSALYTELEIILDPTASRRRYLLMVDIAIEPRVTLSVYPDGANQPLRTEAIPRRIVPVPTALAQGWAGAYTLSMENNLGYVSGRPAGQGQAAAKISTKGALTLAGRLGDGKKFTASAACDTAHAYHLFVRPYGQRAQSYLFGRLAPQSHPDLPDRRYLNAEDMKDYLLWAKAAGPDTNYRDGIGQTILVVALDPWLPPAAAKKATKTAPAQPAVSLAARLRLAPEASSGAAPFGLDYLPATDAPFTAAQLEGLPASLLLAANGKPILPKPNPAKLALSVNPATGAFSGSFVLSDQVKPLPAKPATRTVSFFGTLRQTPVQSGDPVIGTGVFLLPGLTKNAPQSSGEIRFTIP